MLKCTAPGLVQLEDNMVLFHAQCLLMSISHTPELNTWQHETDIVGIH